MNRKTRMTKADDVRETPPALFAARNALHHFTLDACATPANAKCKTFYALDGLYSGAGVWRGVNGMTGPWSGSVWCNPPFSELWGWIAKAWRECARDSLLDQPALGVIDLLAPATRQEQDGWQRLVEPYRDDKGMLVPGWRLSTTFLGARQHFLKDGKPILNPRTGKKSSPKFGCVMLTWTRNEG